MSRIIKFDNIDNIIKRYISGISVNQLSKELGVSRSVVNRVLKSNNVKLRSQSESEKVKWSKMSEQQRKRQVQKAHQSSKGRVVSTAEKIKRAKSAYVNAFKTGLHETTIVDILRYHGFDAVIQKDFGIYNIDISVHGLPICIEVQSSNHQSLRKPKLMKRVKYILNRKQFLLYVIIDQSQNPILYESIANKIISYLNIVSSNKSILGKYAMIGRDGNTFPSSRYDFKGFTRVE